MLTPDVEHTAVTTTRIHWLDNLRTFMVFLVVAIHAGGVYESSGGWALFWIVDDPSTHPLTDILIMIMDIFIIPTLFFVSGCITPKSLEARSAAEFLKAKARRLLIPWIIAVMTLIPLYKIIFLSSRNIPQEHWTTYFHWSAIWSQNWLWFLPVLFLFNVLYVLLSKANITTRKLSPKVAVCGIFLIGFVYSVFMDLSGLRGWTKTPLLDFQNERLLVYFMMFLFGVLCFRQKVFASTPESKKLHIAIALTAWAPIALYRFFYNQSVTGTGTPVFSEMADTLLLWLSFHLSLYFVLYVAVCTFRYYLNGHGRVGNMLNKNAIYVYILHTIVLGGIAAAMLNTAIPSLVKFAILTIATYAVCTLLVHCCRTVIDARMVTKRKKMRAMKALTQASLMVALLSVSGCGKQEGPNEKAPPPHVSIHLAALQGHVDAIQQHIEAGSNLDEKDDYGSSPLIVAVTFGKTQVARALIDAGADMEITNNEGSTPLHVAAFLCRTEIVKTLLDKGADKNARNQSGRTALDTVAGPFDNVKGIYGHLGKGLKPLGLRLDYDRIKRTRPKIAEMLR